MGSGNQGKTLDLPEFLWSRWKELGCSAIINSHSSPPMLSVVWGIVWRTSLPPLLEMYVGLVRGFFSCFWVLSEKSLLSTVDLWLPVFEDLYLNKDYFPSSINGERCDLRIVVQVAKIISACLVAPSFEVSRLSQGCM